MVLLADAPGRDLRDGGRGRRRRGPPDRRALRPGRRRARALALLRGARPVAVPPRPRAARAVRVRREPARVPPAHGVGGRARASWRTGTGTTSARPRATSRRAATCSSAGSRSRASRRADPLARSTPVAPGIRAGPGATLDPAARLVAPAFVGAGCVGPGGRRRSRTRCSGTGRRSRPASGSCTRSPRERSGCRRTAEDLGSRPGRGPVEVAERPTSRAPAPARR